MSNPLVSIIIPTFNRAHLIGETLDSVLAQTYTNWECIVVDDGSTDTTSELMAEYMAKDSRFQYHHRPKDRLPGGNAARNYGFEVSSGEFINWFDSDDLMNKRKLMLQVEALITSSVDFCVCKTSIFEKSIKDSRKPKKHNIFSYDPLNDYITKEITWLTNPPLWKRKFLKKLPYLFDEELKAAQEWDFHVRVLNMKVGYVPINEYLVYHRKHDDKISVNKKQEEQRFLYYFIVRKRVLNNKQFIISEKSNRYLYKYILNLYKKSLIMDYRMLEREIYSFFINQKDLAFCFKFHVWAAKQSTKLPFIRGHHLGRLNKLITENTWQL